MKKIIPVIAVVLILIGGVFVLKNKGSDNELVDFEKQAEQQRQVNPESKTEVRKSGFNAEVVIEPSVDNVISGVVTVRISKAPAGTKLGFFAITGGSIGSIENVGPNLGIDSDGTDGWSILVDTAKYKNGLYEISGIAAESPDDNPLGVATAQVFIQN